MICIKALYKPYALLTAHKIPYQIGKGVQRFFSKKSEGIGSKAFLLGRRNVEKALLFAKWNKSSGRERLYTVDQRHFRPTQPDTVLKEFLDTFPIIVQDLIGDPLYNDIPEVMSIAKELLEYNLPVGKKRCAMSLVHCYKRLEGADNITPEKIKLVNILGWCIEMIQIAGVLADDIIDNGRIRRGKKCWHRIESVGSRAVIDIIIIENYAYQLLKKYFSHLPMYVPAMELVQEAFKQMAFGEILDGTPLDARGLNLSRYTREWYQTIIKYKTTPLGFELPYGLARCLSNKFHTEIPPETHEILKKLGEFLQIQNDFMDCYDDSLTLYNTVNDIEEGRCSWLIVTALERANSDQRRLLEAHYGKKDPESVRIVKELYNIVGVPEVYATYEVEAFNFIEKNIEEVSKLVCHERMFKRLDVLYKQYI